MSNFGVFQNSLTKSTKSELWGKTMFVLNFWFLKNFPVFFFAIVKINNFPSNSKWVPHFCSFKSILAIQSLALTNFTSQSLSALKESVKYTKNIWRQSILIVHQLLMTYTSSMSIWINSMIWIALSFKGKQGLMHHSQKIGSKKELQPTLSNKLNEVSSKFYVIEFKFKNSIFSVSVLWKDRDLYHQKSLLT